MKAVIGAVLVLVLVWVIFSMRRAKREEPNGGWTSSSAGRNKPAADTYTDEEEPEEHERP